MSRIQVVSAVIVRGGRMLLAQRCPESDHPWRWESVGGKVEPRDDSPQAALRRELHEELGVDSVIGQELASFDLDPPRVSKPLRVTFYTVDYITPAYPATNTMIQIGLGWFGRTEVLTLPMLPANEEFRDALAEMLA